MPPEASGIKKSSQSRVNDSHESSYEKSPGKKFLTDLHAQIESYNRQKKSDIPSGPPDAIQNKTGNLQSINETIKNAYSGFGIESTKNSGEYYSDPQNASGELKFDIDALDQIGGEEQKNLTESNPIENKSNVPATNNTELPQHQPLEKRPDTNLNTQGDRPITGIIKLPVNFDKYLSDRSRDPSNQKSDNQRQTRSDGGSSDRRRNNNLSRNLSSDQSATTKKKLEIIHEGHELVLEPPSSKQEGPKPPVEQREHDAPQNPKQEGPKPPDLAGWGKKLWESKDFLAKATESFDKIEGHNIQKLVNRDIEQRVVGEIRIGSEILHTETGDKPARLALATTHGEVFFAERLKTHLEDYREELGKEKERISALQKPFLAIDSTMKEYDELHAIVKNITGSTSGGLTRMRQEIGTSNNEYLKRSSEYINEINATIEKVDKELQKVDELLTHVELLSRFPDHPVFAKEDIRPATATIQIIPSEGRPGTGELTTIKTLLNAQGFKVTDKRLEQTLGKDWFGNIDLSNLETKLRSLGYQKGLQLREIEMQDLKTASSERPMGALLYTSWLDRLRGRSLTVGVERVEWNRRTTQWDVIILDEHRPIPYKISAEKFTEVYSKQGIAPNNP